MRLVDVIAEKKKRDLRLQAVLIANSSGVAFGSIENEKFLEFLDTLYFARSEQNLNDALEKAREDGLPIEDV